MQHGLERAIEHAKSRKQFGSSIGKFQAVQHKAADMHVAVERARALAGAIAVNPKRAGQLRGASVMLVDDVLTSGATSHACVSALKRAGAERVVIACFARVLDEALHLA